MKVRTFRRHAAALLFGGVTPLVAPIALRAQTWTGNASSSWSNASNWSPVAVPTSSASTVLTFGTATSYTSADDLVGFQLNKMVFAAGAPSGYTLNGNSLDFRNSGATSPSISDSSAQNVLLADGLAINGANLDVSVQSSGAITLSGVVTGSGGLSKSGTGTLFMNTSGTNTFAGNAQVNAGTLALQSPTVIPSARNVTVSSGGTLRLDFTSGSNISAPIGTVTLNAGTLRIPAGLADYYVNHLTSSAGGAVDFSGSTNFWVHLTGTGAGIDVLAGTTWTGGGNSNIRNETSGMIDLNITNMSVLNSSIPLDAGLQGQGFQITGSGGFNQQAAGSTAPITVNACAYNFADPTYVTSGALTLKNGGLVNYFGGAAATLAKDITVGSGGGVLSSTGGSLTMSGVISESSALQSLAIGNGTVVLTNTNTYSGTTDMYSNGVASVATIPNGGVAGPLGKSSAAPANLVIEDGKLRYTGSSAATDRGFTVAATQSKIDITNAATNFTFSGQVTGTGGLTKLGPGTMTLTNTTNSFGSGVLVSAGTLSIGSGPNVIPAGKSVSVNSGATFQLGFTSGSNLGSAIGTIFLDGGTLRVPAGAADYFVNGLYSNGGAVDFSGSGNFWLHMIGAGAEIDVFDNATWAGGTGVPGSRIQNDTAGSIDLNIAFGKTLLTGIPLANGPFRITGGGSYAPTTVGSSSALTIANASLYQFGDPTYVTSGALTLQGGAYFNYYGGAPATLAKNITLGTGGAFVYSDSAELTLSGVISESAPAQPLIVYSGPLQLTGLNTYTGATQMWNNSTVSVATIPNGGVAGPLGQSASAASNLVIQLSTLRYTGASASTDRGFTVSDLATVEVSNAATNLTFGGVVAGAGLLSKSGPGTLTLTSPSLTYTGVVQVEEGKLTLATNLTTSVSVNVYSAMMELAAGGGSNRVIKTPDLYIDPAGRLNLQDNKLIITTAGSVGTWNGSAYTGITGLIRSGKGSGNTWNGTTGIVTTQSDAVGHNYTSIGIAKGFEVKSATQFITALWAGQTITGTDTLVMYTYGGDANLDGKINIDDYIKIDNGIAGGLTGWSNGDFNYDGKVNIDDYTTVIDANIGNQNNFIFPTASGASGGFASAGPVSAVPEPAAGVFVVAGISLMRRRRRT